MYLCFLFFLPLFFFLRLLPLSRNLRRRTRLICSLTMRRCPINLIVFFSSYSLSPISSTPSSAVSSTGRRRRRAQGRRR
ncbi:unnamed protein product [Brassica rapa subsp. trilocularis]